MIFMQNLPKPSRLHHVNAILIQLFNVLKRKIKVKIQEREMENGDRCMYGSLVPATSRLISIHGNRCQ